MVPSNFSVSGRIQSYTSKEAFLVLYLVVVAGTAFFFPGLGFLTIRKPVSKINVPNKDYWLAPERRQGTFDFIIIHMSWFGSATLLFVMRMFHSCYRAALGSNLNPDPRLPNVWISGLIYGGFMLVWGIVPGVRFSKKE
jgi:hypothetical protein